MAEAVDAADAVRCGDVVERFEERDGRKLFAVDGYRDAGFEANLNFGGRVWRFFRRDDPLPHGFVGRVGGIFETAAFVREMPNVAIAAVNVGGGLLDGNFVRASVGNRVFARENFPFAPGSDDLQFGAERFVGELEADLVVSLAGAAVGDSIGAVLERDFDLPFGDDGARERRAEQILVLVDRASAKRGPNILGDELFAEILDRRGRGAGGEGFFARGFEIFLLADVCNHGNHFAAAVILFQPRNNDGGIEPAAIGEHYFFRHFEFPLSSAK